MSVAFLPLPRKNTVAFDTDDATYSTDPPELGRHAWLYLSQGVSSLDTYITELSVDDNSLKTLFTKVPGRCVILLEDVENAKLESPEGAASLSALLDAINSTGDGHVIIMTTRHLELVDNALTGRVDVKTEFQLANKEMITQLFRFACSGSSVFHLPPFGNTFLRSDKPDRQ